MIVGALEGMAQCCDQLDGGVVTLTKDYGVAVDLCVGVIRDQETGGPGIAFADGHGEKAGAIEEQGRVCFDRDACGRRLLGRCCGSGGNNHRIQLPKFTALHAHL